MTSQYVREIVAMECREEGLIDQARQAAEVESAPAVATDQGQDGRLPMLVARLGDHQLPAWPQDAMTLRQRAFDRTRRKLVEEEAGA